MSHPVVHSCSPKDRARGSIRVTIESPELDARASEQVARMVESNRIVHFPRSPVPLPGPEALRHLREQLTPLLKSNVTYHPHARRLVGLRADRGTRARAIEILSDHLDNVTAFLRRVMPRQCESWTVAEVSFRPLQEHGRKVHVDAQVHGATDGDRVLRFFVNIHEHEDRVWASHGIIEDVLDRHGIDSGLLDRTGRLKVRLDVGPGDRARRLAIGALSLVNPLLWQRTSGPYDRAMLQLQRYMKDSERFQSDLRDYEEMRFAPGAAWLLFTDGVSHASVSGQHALVSTFILRRKALCHAHHAPYNVLEAHR